MSKTLHRSDFCGRDLISFKEVVFQVPLVGSMRLCTRCSAEAGSRGRGGPEHIVTLLAGVSVNKVLPPKIVKATFGPDSAPVDSTVTLRALTPLSMFWAFTGVYVYIF